MPEDSLLRLRLRVALKLMVLAAAVVASLVLLGTLFSGPDGHVPLPLEVELDGIEPGSERQLSWSGRRVLVLHRDAAMLGVLAADDELYDPVSRLDRRPRGVDSRHRGRVPEWLVVYHESTDLGCELDLVRPGTETGWGGGFRDRCRSGRYDFAGRVYKGQPARRNLQIPPYQLQGSRLILGAE